MPESSVVVQPDPIGSSRLQTVGLRTATKLFEQAAAEVPLPAAPRPVVIAEYGSGNAHNGLLPIGAGITALRKRIRPEHPIAVTHTDIPDNDFSALFRTLRDDPFSYLRTDRATFASAVGRSYLSQILPSEGVHLGWSAWAIQWLSRMPADIPDHIQPSYSADAQVRAAYARQAAHDWHEFIAFRGRELSPGGRLVVMTMGQHDDGRLGLEPLFDGLMRALSELQDQRLVSAEEARHYRSMLNRRLVQPMTRLLLGAPAVQLIRWAQSRFPGLLPGGVIDSHPLMSPEGTGPRPLATPFAVGFIPAGEN